MKYLSRNKIYERTEPSKDAKKIYVICEGEKREIEYFNFFQGLASNINIIPIPSDNGKSDPVKLKEQAERLFLEEKKYELSKEYLDEVWFVIDTDRWNEGGKIDLLKTFVQEKNKSYKGWFVAQSNPAFEIWLYYHFHLEKPKSEEVALFETFKEFVGEQIKGGFNNRTMPVEIQQAAVNAEQNFERAENGQPQLYSTEIFNLAKQIIKFTKAQLDKGLEQAKTTKKSD